MRRHIAVLTAVVLILPVGAAAFAHKADLIGRGRVADLRYGRATFDDAVDLFGSPTNRRRVDGCVRTLIARWSGIKLWFDRSEPSRVVINGFVLDRNVPTADGGSMTIHTRRGLRVEDTVKKLKRLYPDARGSRARGGKRRYLLEGRNGGAYLQAVAQGGRVVRLLSGFTC